MNVLVSGGTGFVGKALISKLTQNDAKVWVLTRQPDKYKRTANIKYVSFNEELPSFDAVVNLAGETINGRWTKSKKNKILQSRLETTKRLIELMQRQPEKPAVFINASAIGFYGISKSKTFTEADTNPGEDFLASVVAAWEQEASIAEELGIRTVLTRFGMILGENEGALPKMLLPYQLFIGGPIGSGQQWISWVHVDDVVGLIEFCITNENIRGPLNATAPSPVKMNDFGKAIGKVLSRPHWFPTPSLPLKILLGEMSILVLEGQKVLPEKALQHGYDFKYKDVESALQSVIKSI